MENASKALLIAAGMLVAVLVASMFALFFSTISEYSKQYEETRQAQNIQEFNAQFTQYMKPEGSSAQDIVSVYNLAEYYREKEGIEVKVFVGAHELPENSDKPFPGNLTSEEFINTNTNVSNQFDPTTNKSQYKINNFTANITYDNGMINSIEFTLTEQRTLYEK